MTDAKIVGGSEADRSKLLDLHEEYLVANGKFDWLGIKPMWSEEPHATFFNLNGHTYKGAEHWSRLWAFYIKNVKGSYWTPFDIGGEIKGEMAVIWCHRRSQRNWVGTTATPPRDIHYQGQEFVSRSTMVFHKEGGQWRVVHAHFSVGDSGERPGGV
jgi:ketosteroid isomerase-like protein